MASQYTRSSAGPRKKGLAGVPLPHNPPVATNTGRQQLWNSSCLLSLPFSFFLILLFMFLHSCTHGSQQKWELLERQQECKITGAGEQTSDQSRSSKRSRAESPGDIQRSQTFSSSFTVRCSAHGKGKSEDPVRSQPPLFLHFKAPCFFSFFLGIPAPSSVGVVSCLILSTVLCFQCSACVCTRVCVCVCVGLTQRAAVLSALCPLKKMLPC